MSTLLRFPVCAYHPLFGVRSHLASLNIASTRFKSKHQSERGDKKEHKQCGAVKKRKDKDEGEEKRGHHKSEKDDKCQLEKGHKGNKEKGKHKSKGEKHGKHEDDGSGSEAPAPVSEFPRIGINGFGRIGRMVMRIAAEYSCPLEILAVNDPEIPPEYMAYLLKYDSTHKRFPTDVEVDGNMLVMEERKVRTFQEKNPKNIPWKDLGVDYVIDASGKNLTAEKSQGHLDAGAKHVIVSAPCKDDSPTFVVGVNLEEYNTKMKVVSAASCATNALAPIAKVLNDKFEIIEGIMTTVHAVTASQKILDNHSRKNWRESRGAMQNMIPTITGAAVAVAKVIPELQGKMTAISIRVPTPNVSMIDFTFRTKTCTSLEDITKAMEEASEGDMLGVIDVTKDQVVSSDFLGSYYSVIYDSKASLGLNKNFFKVVAWYDNEYGYTCRVIDLIKYMHAEAKEQEEKEKKCSLH